MPHEILMILYLGAAAVIAYGWVSQRGSVERQLRTLGISTAGIAISRMLGLVGLATLAIAWLTGPPAELAVAVAALVLLWASSEPRLLIRQRSTERQRARAIWRELDTLAEERFDGPYDEDPRREAYASAMTELQHLRGPRTAELGRLLAEQAPNWLFERRWSIDTARREMLLFQLATKLWPDDPPPQDRAPIDGDTLWLLFVAIMKLDETWRPEYSEFESRERLRRADALERFRQPETARLIDAEQQLAYEGVGQLPMSREEVDRLRSESQRETDRLFPSLRVFRGVSAEPQAFSSDPQRPSRAAGSETD